MMDASTWMPLAITQAWQVTGLALFVWLVVNVAAKQRPHLAHALWALVLLKCITPPLLSSPSSAFSWLRHPAFANAMNSIQAERGEVQNDTRQSFAIPISTAEYGAWTSVSTRSTNVSQPVPQSSPARIDETRNSEVWLCRLLLGMLSLGTLLGLGWTTIRLWLFLRRAHAATAPPEARVGDLVLQLSQRLKVQRPVRVLLVESSIGPAVVGFWRPTILLPAAIVREKSTKSLRPLIAHELVHIRRGDLVWATLQTLCTSLWWFHPLVWLASRMLTREAERSCDEETIASLGCSPAEYARELLDVLARKHQLRVAPALPGVRPVDVTAKRLERIMRLGQGCHRSTPSWVWAVLLIGAALVLPGEAWVIGQESSEANRIPVAVPSESDTLGPWLSQWEHASIDVADLLARIDWLPDRPATETYLLGQLPIRSLADINREGARFGAQLSSRPTVKLHENQLVVFETRDQIRKIRERVEQLRVSGFDLVKLEMLILSIPHEELASELGQWNRQQTPVGSVAFASFAKFSRPRSEVATLLAGQAGQPSREMGDAPQVEAAPPALSPPTSPKPPETAEDILLRRAADLESAALRVDQRVLATHNIFSPQELLDFLQFGRESTDDRQLQDVLRELQRSEDIQLVSRPMIMTLNAHPATATIGGSRLFVVDEVVESSPSRRSAEALPETVEILSEGLGCSVFPRLNADAQQLQLDCRLSVTVLSESAIDRASGDVATHSKNEVPVLDRNTMEAAVTLPIGHTLAMAGISDPQDQERALVMLVTANIGARAANQANAKTPQEPEARLDDAAKHEPIELLGATSSGGPASAIAPPSDDEVLNVLNRRLQDAGQPEITTAQVRSITREKIADYVDPVRFVPILGPARLHHAHYKCQVKLNAETDDTPTTVYIDHQHFHMSDPVDLILSAAAANKMLEPAEAELIGRLGEFGLSAWIDGHFEHVLSEGSLVIRGRGLSAVQADKSLEISADRGEIVLKPGAVQRMNLSGSVRLHVRGSRIMADIIRIEGDQLTAEGSVQLKHKGIEVTTERLTLVLATGVMHVSE